LRSSFCHRLHPSAIMNTFAFLVFTCASLGLMGCGGIDCVDTLKKQTENLKQIADCSLDAGGDADALKKCKCDFYPANIKISKEAIDGDCFAEGTTDAQKEAAKKDLKSGEKNYADAKCGRQATV